MSELKNTVENSFIQYAGAVLQSRALVDVRDCLKPSARQIFYSMLERKLVHKNPYKKTANAVGMAMADYYIHGDSSCEGVIMRAGQDFAMRYPLVEVKGNMGSLMESGNWAAMRYTESRLSSLSDILFNDIKKNTIEDWRDNYDNTKQYPGVLPSKGFYNIVNGTTGIGIGMASSIPQFNLKEVNQALIKLLWNSDIDFEEIYCSPDFATGGILLNESQVKESLKNGQGFSCKLRSVVEFNSDERCFIVTEIPYGVYTNTICGQIENIINGDENPGIERFTDLTGATPLIKIYISKKANANNILKFLYKNTSLQSHFGINFTMLENGKFPKVFTWKSALQAHINHEINVYTRGYEYDAKKIKDRLHILNGLLIAMANIDEVVKVIKSSSSTLIASKNLQTNFLLDEVQAKAILDMKLSRLAHLEVKKLEEEKENLEIELNKLEAILNNEVLLKKEIEKGLLEVANKFGDKRRTQILNIEQEEEEPVEIKKLIFNLTNKGNIYISETNTLYVQRRGGVGVKFKLEKDEFIINSFMAETIDTILFFTQKGDYYTCSVRNIPIEDKIPIESIIQIKDYEYICAATSFNKNSKKENILFITKQGLIKKSKLDEYKTNRNIGIKALELNNGDEIASVEFADDEKIAMLSSTGKFVICETKDINPLKRAARGRKGINLDAGAEVVCARIIDESIKEIISVSKDGYIKKTDVKDFSVNGLGTKGKKIQSVKNTDQVIDFLPISNDNSIIAISTGAQIKIDVKEIPSLSTGAQGNKVMKMKENQKIKNLAKN